jgi:hypothetical protein
MRSFENGQCNASTIPPSKTVASAIPSTATAIRFRRRFAADRFTLDRCNAGSEIVRLISFAAFHFSGWNWFFNEMRRRSL